jgi:hypothetical protein
MANRSDFQTVILVGALTLLVGGAGLYLGFNAGRAPRSSGPAVPKVPDTGPIVYEMRSVRSDPDRVRFEWRAIDGAEGYRVAVMTAQDEPIFESPMLTTNSWTIPPAWRSSLTPRTVYHWRLTVLLPKGEPRVSEPAAFATQ